jgi:hypothetical protein
MHMTNLKTRFASAMLIGSLASITLIVAIDGVAHAADNCLSGPKGTAPKGGHWYYRVDHAAKRNCWYVRAEGGQAASPNASVTQASPKAETSLRPSVANARAEAAPADIAPSNGVATLPAPSGAAKNGQSSDASGTDDTQSTVTSRWLDQPGADSRNPSAPGPADAGANLNPPASTVAEAPLAAADMPAASGVGPVQTLLLAIVGAMALAGLMAGIIFRFGSAGQSGRQHMRDARRAPWDSIDVKLATPSPPLAASVPSPRTDAAHERLEAIIPNEIVQLLSKLSKEAAA